MSTPLVATGMAEQSSRDASRQELQSRLNGLSGLKGKDIDPATKAKKLREACEGFESVFIQKMWQEMRNTLPKGGLLQGREEKFWQDMYDQELSKSMTRAGGIGLADMMYEQLSRNLVSASRTTADTGAGRKQLSAFTPSVAPLLPRSSDGSAAAEVQTAQETSTAAAQSDRTGTAHPADNAPANAAVNTAAQTGGTSAARTGAGQQLAEAAPAQAGAADRQQAGEAQQAAAGQPAQGRAQPVLTNPAIERALADLRRQRGQSRTAQPEALQAAAPAGDTAAAPTRRQGMTDGLSGLQMAQIARRQAGDQLGPGAVRHPLQPPVGGPETTRVRYQTNIPQKGRSPRARQLMQAFNEERANPGSRAGEGLAAYHRHMAQGAQAGGSTEQDRARQAQAAQMQAEALQSQIVQQIAGKGMSTQMLGMQAQNGMGAMPGMGTGMGTGMGQNPLGLAGQQMALQSLMTQGSGAGVTPAPLTGTAAVSGNEAAPQGTSPAGQMAAGQSAAQAAAQRPSLQSQKADAAPAARQRTGSAQASGSFSIPPLTAADARG